MDGWWEGRGRVGERNFNKKNMNKKIEEWINIYLFVYVRFFCILVIGDIKLYKKWLFFK